MKHTAALLACLTLMAGTASADLLTYTTGLAGSGGTVSWAGGASGLTGTGIRVGLLQASATPQNAGMYFINGPSGPCSVLQGILVGSCGDLEFSTGAFMGTTTVGGDTLLNFSTGGSFTLTGGIAGSSSPTVGPNTVMLNGNFTGITTFNVNNGIFTVSNGSGEAYADPLLQAFFGIHTEIPFQFTIQVLDGAPGKVGAFSQSVSSMQMNTSPVPEPTSIILLTLVLFGCSAILYQRRPSRKNS
jgi:hypothetical protein